MRPSRLRTATLCVVVGALLAGLVPCRPAALPAWDAHRDARGSGEELAGHGAAASLAHAEPTPCPGHAPPAAPPASLQERCPCGCGGGAAAAVGAARAGAALLVAAGAPLPAPDLLVGVAERDARPTARAHPPLDPVPRTA